MAGTLSANVAVGTSTEAQILSSGQLNVTANELYSKAAVLAASGALDIAFIASQLVAFGNLNSAATLIFSTMQKYNMSALFGANGALGGTAIQSYLSSMNLGAAGSLSAIRAIVQRELVNCSLGSTGQFNAGIEAINFSPFNVENTNVSSELVPAASSGCWVQLIGAGGAGGKNYSSGSTGGSGRDTLKYGASGGGGGARIPRFFIPKSSLGTTYSVTRGLGVANSNGNNSVFSSGSISLIAGGGVKGGNWSASGPTTGGAGGTCSVTGVSTTNYSGTAGANNTANSGSKLFPNGSNAINNSNAGAGGGSGGGANISSTPTYGTGGTGGVGYVGNGGDGGDQNEDGFAATGYGNGSGGSGWGSSVSTPGANGYTLIEWV